MKNFYLLLTAALAAGAFDAAALDVATFEELPLENESYWYGDLDDEDYMYGSFASGSFTFSNLCMADYDTWAFFGYSNRTATDFKNLMPDQFNCVVGSGVNGSKTFAVAYVAAFMGHTEITVGDGTENTVVPGTWLANSAYTAESILKGDAYAGDAYTKGDWYKVTFTGLDADGTETASVDFYTADYRSENESEHYFLSEWGWCDLSGLGSVAKIRVSASCSRNNAYGALTPTYVCLDDFGAASPEAGILAPEAAGLVLRSELVSMSGLVVSSCEGSFDSLNGAVPAGIYILRTFTASGVESRKVAIR